MLSAIAALSVGAWFYYTASRSGRPSVSWAISGVIVYLLAALLWTLLVTPGIKDAAGHSQNGLLIFMVRYAYIFVGAGAAVLLNVLANKAGDTK